MWKTKFGKCIYKSPSGYRVFQNFFYRWLTLGSSAYQTVINRRNPKIPILHYIRALTLLARAYPGTCCLLGLGGAGIPHMLSSKQVQFPITVVDISDEVIQIAKQFFMLDQIPNIHVVHQNAKDYIQETKEQFNHLLIDLYGAHSFPNECLNDEFFINCKNKLTPEGFMAINIANPEERSPIFKLVKIHFPTTFIIPVKESANMIIISSNISENSKFIKAIQDTNELKKISWVKLWGFVGKY